MDRLGFIRLDVVSDGSSTVTDGRSRSQFVETGLLPLDIESTAVRLGFIGLLRSILLLDDISNGLSGRFIINILVYVRRLSCGFNGQVVGQLLTFLCVLILVITLVIESREREG